MEKRDRARATEGRRRARRAVIGCCESANLCELHRVGMFEQLRGVASTRGEVWADTVAARRPRMVGQPWPVKSPRMMSIARSKVADLAHDERLLELLAVELASWAARRWDEFSSQAAHQQRQP